MASIFEHYKRNFVYSIAPDSPRQSTGNRHYGMAFYDKAGMFDQSKRIFDWEFFSGSSLKRLNDKLACEMTRILNSKRIAVREGGFYHDFKGKKYVLRKP